MFTVIFYVKMCFGKILTKIMHAISVMSNYVLEGMKCVQVFLQNMLDLIHLSVNALWDPGARDKANL